MTIVGNLFILFNHFNRFYSMCFKGMSPVVNFTRYGKICLFYCEDKMVAGEHHKSLDSSSNLGLIISYHFHIYCYFVFFLKEPL